MIEINLLSQEPVITRTGKIRIETKYFAYLIPSVFAVLILAQLCIAAVAIAQRIQYSSLNASWDKLKPQREMLNNLKKGYDVLTSDARLIQELDKRRIIWSEKLNRMSLDLPSGIWFNEIQVSPKELVLKGSAVSLQKEEMSLIKIFLDTLKGDTRFLRDFSSLELGAVQKRQIGGYDVVDFILTAKIKAR